MPQRTDSPADQDSPTPWPDGIFARYLTTGGATVDLTRTADPATADARDWDQTHAVCTGCETTKFTHWIHSGTGISVPEAAVIADKEIRAWAQGHAEVCRALPRPETTGGAR